MNKAIISGFLCLGIIAADSGKAGELPVETFFKNYEYDQVRLSPDGNWLAALAPTRKKRVGLVVVDLEKRAAQFAYGDRTLDVAWFRWATTNRLLFGFSKDGYLERGFMAVNRDGSRPSQLVAIGSGGTQFLHLLPNSPDEILVNTWLFSPTDLETGFRFPHVSRMNIFTGEMKREVTNPGRVVHWVVDHSGVIRAGVSWEEARLRVIYRDNNQAPWQRLAEYNFDEDGIWPMGFDADNRTLFVSHPGDQEMDAVYKFDIQSKKLQDLAFRHEESDVGELLFSTKGDVLGVTYETDRPGIYWLDPAIRKLQASVDRALPETLNSFVSTSRDGAKTIVLARNDRTPGTYYLLDTATLKMEKLFDRAGWINPVEMAEMKPIQYRSRDGLTIHGYLTLPKGCAGKNLPLVVNPHGGPIARDTWGFDPEAQFFANRGYAVLRMNFRGSTGYGKTFQRAGYKQWGLKQQNDITDGVRWALEQGIADPKRICIYGASYGGFAALTGLEQTPELYGCGICYAGVTEIARTLKYSVPEIKIMKAAAAEMVGDTKKEKERLQATSPLYHADKIQVPVLLAYGKLDPLVPVSTGRELARALKKRDHLYGFIVKEDEGHGFFKEENRLELWNKVDEFLKATLR